MNLNFTGLILYLLIRNFNNSDNKKISIDIGDKYKLEFYINRIELKNKEPNHFKNDLSEYDFLN